MAHFIRTRLRSNVKRSNNVRKASAMADVFMRAVYRDDRKRLARAERADYDREVNKVRDHHSGNGRITVWRRG